MPEENGNGGQVQTFTQAEVDTLVAARVEAATAALKEQFAGIDANEYKALKEAESKRAEEALLAKGEYEKLVAKITKESEAALEAERKAANEKITKLTERLERSEVDAKLLAAAHKALKPDQVAALLRPTIKNDLEKGVTIVDAAGNVVTKNGKPITIEEHVAAFLEANPHHLPPIGSGYGTQGSIGGGSSSANYTITAEEARDPAKYRAAKEAATKAGKTLEIVRTQ